MCVSGETFALAFARALGEYGSVIIHSYKTAADDKIWPIGFYIP